MPLELEDDIVHLRDSIGLRETELLCVRGHRFDLRQEFNFIALLGMISNSSLPLGGGHR